MCDILFMPKKCKYKSDKQRYGPFPLGNRLGVDQVLLELNQRDFTLETKGTTDAVYIRGPKKDIEKRQATLQLAIRVKRIQEDKSYHVSSVQKNARHPT